MDFFLVVAYNIFYIFNHKAPINLFNNNDAILNRDGDISSISKYFVPLLWMYGVLILNDELFSSG